VGVDSACEQKKLEARKMPVKRADSTRPLHVEDPAQRGCVGLFLIIDHLSWHDLEVIKMQSEGLPMIVFLGTLPS